MFAAAGCGYLNSKPRMGELYAKVEQQVFNENRSKGNTESDSHVIIDKSCFPPDYGWPISARTPEGWRVNGILVDILTGAVILIAVALITESIIRRGGSRKI